MMIVYSCLFGDYDQIPPIPNKEDGVRYMIFTDKTPPPPEPWETIILNSRDNPRRLSRRNKIMSNFLPAHDISIYVDSNLRFTGAPLVPFANECLKHADIALPQHLERSSTWRAFSHKCTYSEAEVCIRARLDNGEVIKEQMARYKEAGFPQEYGLGENCFIIRRNTDAIHKLNALWWQEYNAGSQRDQLSLMFCLWQTGTPFHLTPINSRTNDYYTQVDHLKSRVVA